MPPPPPHYDGRELSRVDAVRIGEAQMKKLVRSKTEPSQTKAENGTTPLEEDLRLLYG